MESRKFKISFLILIVICSIPISTVKDYEYNEDSNLKIIYNNKEYQKNKNDEDDDRVITDDVDSGIIFIPIPNPTKPVLLTPL